jgi:hypothetical protein
MAAPPASDHSTSSTRRTRRSPREHADRLFQGVDTLLRETTGGVRPRDLARLFDQEAPDAYSVLTRDHGLGPEPKEPLRRALYRARLVLAGFSRRLSPARRVLFLASLFSAFLGLLDFGFALDLRGRLVFDSSPLWFVFSIAGLVLLLGLELVEQVRVRDELEVARALQRELLPHTTPLLPGYRIRHAYRTANEVGGDYYDFAVLEDGRVALVVGDASGHGMAAGLLMAIANSALNLALDLDPSPRAVLDLLNRSLVRIGGRQAFMSLFYGLLDPSTGRLDWATAGHPFPLLRRAADGRVEEIGAGGLPLGLRSDLDVPFGSTQLHNGDLLVLYSDGLPEALDRAEQAFGYERLRLLVEQNNTPETAHEAILGAFDRHLAGAALRDDFSLVVVGRMTPPPLPQLPRIPPPPPPAPTR